MNKIHPISTEYITPSRSIETLTLVTPKESILIYIYNFEGIHFRFFDSILKLIEFFETGIEPETSFTSEGELDKFLEGFGLGESASQPNLKLNYRYRDAGNYKQFGSVVFSNSSNLSLDEATKLIQEKLISSEFFVPKEWKLPSLHLHPYDPELDHEYHEFENWELTDDAPTDKREALLFVKEIQIGI